MSNPRNDLTYTFTVVARPKGRLFFIPIDQVTADYASHAYGSKMITKLSPDFDTCNKYVLVKREDEIIDMGQVEWYGTHGAGLYFCDMKYLYNRNNLRAELQDDITAYFLFEGDKIEIVPEQPENYREFKLETIMSKDRNQPAPKA